MPSKEDELKDKLIGNTLDLILEEEFKNMYRNVGVLIDLLFLILRILFLKYILT